MQTAFCYCINSHLSGYNATQRRNGKTHTEEVREDAGVFGTWEWLQKYMRWQPEQQASKIPSTRRRGDPFSFVIIYRHGTDHIKLHVIMTINNNHYLLTLLTLLTLFESSSLEMSTLRPTRRSIHIVLMGKPHNLHIIGAFRFDGLGFSNRAGTRTVTGKIK